MRSFQSPPVSAKVAQEINTIKSWIEQSTHPLYLEVGCGVGFHPIQFAQQNPEKRLLAFERTSEKFKSAQQRYLGNGSPKNLLIAHGDVSFFITELFLQPNARVKLAGIFILYPNPYPKKSQANLRFAHMPMTLVLAELLLPSGVLILASNKAEYIEEMAAVIPRKTGLRVLKIRHIEPGARPRSHFEKKYLARGETCQEIHLGHS